MNHMLPNSPFSQTELKPLGKHTRKGSHIGMLMPDGKVLVNFNESTSQTVLGQIADAIGAELIVVSGTWEFTPDSTQAFKKIARRRS